MTLKENCMEYYSKVCRFIESGDYEEAAINIRHILELLLKELISVFAPEHVYDNTFTQIEVLDNLDVLKQGDINKFHNLRKIGNKGGHVNEADIITKQELVNAIPVLKSLIDSCIETISAGTAAAETHKSSTLRQGEEKLNYLKRFFSGRTMYTKIIDGGECFGGAKVSFNDDVFEIESTFQHVVMHVTGINEYNILMYDEAYWNQKKLLPNVFLIRIDSLNLDKDEWGHDIGYFQFEFQFENNHEKFTDKFIWFPFLFADNFKHFSFRLNDEWKGQSIRLAGIFNRIRGYLKNIISLGMLLAIGYFLFKFIF